MEKEIFLTRDELMKYIKIKRSTLQNLMNRRAFPYYKLERRVLFKKSDIDSWLESKRVK